ncbi:MAG: vWA domain-containing protein [Bacteroidia bacterium]
MLILDASRSMAQSYNGEVKFSIAQKLCYRLLDSLEKNSKIELGLRVYGAAYAYPPGKCTDSKLVIPFKSHNAKAIRTYISTIRPKGITPIAYSLQQAIQDFPKGLAQNHILIITDGIEECSGNMCASAEQLHARQIAFKPCIIGIGLTVTQQNLFNCVGSYFDIKSPQTFTSVLNIIASNSEKPGTYQINLLNSKGQPLEERVAFSIADTALRIAHAQWVHSLNAIEVPDTIYTQAPPFFKIKLHTIPEQVSTTQRLKFGLHSIIPIPAQQGSIEIRQTERYGNDPQFVYTLIRSENADSIFHCHPLNTNVKYIAGTYAIDILTLPTMHYKNYAVKPDSLKILNIAKPGTVEIKSLRAGDGCIQVWNSEHQQWISIVPFHAKNQLRFTLQPGTYRIFWRNRIQASSINTIERTFSMQSDQHLIFNFPY